MPGCEIRLKGESARDRAEPIPPISDIPSCLWLTRSPFDDHGSRSVVEFRFMAIALSWLSGIVQATNRTLQDPALTVALRRFQDAVPEARYMRNIGEHLPAYIQGRGDMQNGPDPVNRRGDLRELGVMIWTGFDGRGTHLTWAGTDLDVEVARTAADQLYVALRDAIRPHLVIAPSQTDQHIGHDGP